MKIAEYDEGEWADAMNDAVKACETEFVILSAPDAWFEQEPPATEFLADLAWDCDVTWGPLLVFRDGQPLGKACETAFCPNRLTRENYMNSVFCVRRDKFLEVGGVTSGLWDLQVRIMKAGGRFKFVPEALCARDEEWADPSPEPEPVDVKASFYHQATPGTTYWRCQLPARWLPGQAIFNHPYAEPDEHGLPKFVNHAGTAVFQYAGDLFHHQITRQLQDQGYRVLIEVDDDYTNWFKEVMPRAGWKRTIAEAAPNGFSVEQHRFTVEIADGVIVTTERLANRYRKLNPNVFVCPNQIDPVDWPEVKKPDDGIFRIGWFASGSHREDGQIIRRALEWASRQPNVEVNLIGIGVGPDGRPWYPFDFKYRPWSNDLSVYRRFLLDLDVGLAPVVGSPWAQGRSDLKALEYAMAGAVPFVSDVDPYKGCEVPGIMHCPTPKAFLSAVQWAVANQHEIKDLAREARAYVLDERTVEANIDKWEAAVAG